MTLRSIAGLVATLCVCCGSVSAQKNTASTDSMSAGSQAPTKSGNEEASSPAGFSIETEMFTYKAVEQNSEIIACDVARFLFGGQVTLAPAGSHAACTVTNPAQASPGIVLVSSNNSVVSDLQLWRADMATMSVFNKRAALVCLPYKSQGNPPNANGSQPNGTNNKQQPGSITSKGAGTSIPELGNSLLSTAITMLARNESISSVSGTVKDDALMNEVARQLRSLNVQVLIPEIYSPMGSDDDLGDSLYTQKLEGVSTLEQTCDSYTAGYPVGDPNRNAITALTTDIQNFEKALTSPPQVGGNSQSNSSANGPSHLTKVFAVDQVARKLFSATQDSDSGQWQYVLWLQALESGGSVVHESSFLGTKIRFSGGAVDSYAVFRVDGQLTCSGNVFNFQSPTLTKDLEKTFTSKSAINLVDSPMLQSTCALLPPIKKSVTDINKPAPAQ